MSIEEAAKNISMAQVACYIGEEFTRESLKQVSYHSAMAGIMQGLSMRSDRIAQLETELRMIWEHFENHVADDEHTLAMKRYYKLGAELAAGIRSES